VLVAGFPSQMTGTNCYVMATGPGEHCLVIDPGIGVVDRLTALLEEHRLHPAAVLLTHGHFDHTFSVAPVSKGIKAYIHPEDREMLRDPTVGVSAEFGAMLAQLGGFVEPDDVALMTDGVVLDIAGLQLIVDHAPGHTRGSVMFRTAGDPVNGPEPLCFSGDVLFEGSIGRTDLPGGDGDTMVVSLRDKVLTLADETVVLPGHGNATTIGKERATNPYLLQVIR
jgi:hydroxyacylglutathione hydrolase